LRAINEWLIRRSLTANTRDEGAGSTGRRSGAGETQAPSSSSTIPRSNPNRHKSRVSSIHPRRAKPPAGSASQAAGRSARTRARVDPRALVQPLDLAAGCQQFGQMPAPTGGVVPGAAWPRIGPVKHRPDEPVQPRRRLCLVGSYPLEPARAHMPRWDPQLAEDGRLPPLRLRASYQGLRHGVTAGHPEERLAARREGRSSSSR